METGDSENYTLKRVIFANIVIFVWLVLGIYAIWLVVPFLAVAWGIFLALMFLFVMRKSICTKCRYYDGRCSMGWSWYTSKIFKEGNVEDFPGCFGARFAPFLWMSVSLLPVIVLAISMVFEFSILKAVILVLLILIAYIFGNKKSRKKSCSVCRMNDLCPMGIAMVNEGNEKKA
ncbi:hypothetical protein [Methanolacinia petrolearia]|uniref:hypothetical protein n=1 Tax=Methanolacinia petrolearia TaxID=54120 RepID=UPI003BACAD6C